MTLSIIMRHDDPINTLKYVQHLVFYEDLKTDYKAFQFGFIQKDVKSEVEKVAATV